MGGVRPYVLLIEQIYYGAMLTSIFFYGFFYGIVRFVPYPTSIQVVSSYFVGRVFIMPRDGYVSILQCYMYFSIPLVRFFSVFQRFIRFRFITIYGLIYRVGWCVVKRVSCDFVKVRPRCIQRIST